MEPDYSLLTERDRQRIALLIQLRDEGRFVDLAIDWTRDEKQESRTYPHLYSPPEDS